MSERIQVPDPALMRRAGGRMIRAMIFILVLVTPFTLGGSRLLAAGELPALPLAVGGLVLAAAAVALTVTNLRVRRTLDGCTVARSAMAAARRANRWIRAAVVATLAGLLGFGLIRLTFGDKWSILTALLVSVALFFLARGLTRIIRAQSQGLGYS